MFFTEYKLKDVISYKHRNIMVLFNYGGCKKCQSKMNDTKLVLSNILPANVCEKISSYNVYCNRCCITRDLEKFFVEEHKGKGYTKKFNYN